MIDELEQYFNKAQAEMPRIIPENSPPETVEDRQKQLNQLVKPLRDTEADILDKIVAAPSVTELKEQFELFNINQAKKEALRSIRLSGMQEKIEAQMDRRISNRPDCIDNKTLIEFYNAIANQLTSIRKEGETTLETTPIKSTGPITQVNVNVGPQLDRESRDKVIDFVSAILKKAQEEEFADETEENTDVTDQDI